MLVDGTKSPVISYWDLTAGKHTLTHVFRTNTTAHLLSPQSSLQSSLDNYHEYLARFQTYLFNSKIVHENVYISVQFSENLNPCPKSQLNIQMASPSRPPSRTSSMPNLQLHNPDKKAEVPKARKSTASSGVNSSHTSMENKELDRLKFKNPGRQMEDLKFKWPEGNFTRSFRKQLTSKRKQKNRGGTFPSLYDSRGRLLGTLADTCDCLREGCPGCHLPCRRCHSMYCGPVCRIYRNFRFREARLFI
ncbi:unnamed protein product [Calicophoron daubneyi]|uniref:ARF7 effector protein C-terminal domain-containing protein n=1 Tax=Calicophoron daubneyi TaxID=300641 RepID=A0AAV2TI82_CALDB